MLDRTIPIYNTILRCDHYQHREVVLPCGFSIVPYEKGFEKAWAELEYAIGDFGSLVEAEYYFVVTYLQNQALFSNILFLLVQTNLLLALVLHGWTSAKISMYLPCISWLWMKNIMVRD